MSKTISLADMAVMHRLSPDALRRYAEEGRVPSHRHHVTGEVVFIDSDMFRIDRDGLLASPEAMPPAGTFAPGPSAWSAAGGSR